MPLTLLILTDFFQAANQALAYASNLAGPLGAQQVLLHVCRDSVLDPETFTGRLSNHSQSVAAIALYNLVSNLPGPVVVEVGHGQVAGAVADAVRHHHPVLVVLGRPDTAGTPDELVSTTALDLLRSSPQPMLVVPHSITTTHPPRRVLLAVDAEEFSLGHQTSPMRSLLNSLRAEVTVLHVWQEKPAADATAGLLEIVRKLELTHDLPQPVRTLSHVAPDVAEAILRAAQPADFDLVIVIARQRSYLRDLFHHSVTAQVLLHSAVPVLVLPAQA